MHTGFDLVVSCTGVVVVVAAVVAAGVDAVDVIMVLEEIGSVTFSGNSSAVVHGDDGLDAR